MRKLLLLMLILLVMIPVFAQDDAVDRVVNSTPPEEAFESYSALWTFESSNLIAIDFAGMALELSSSVNAEATIQATLNDNPNVVALLTYTAEEADDTGVVSYTIEAEVRLVDGELYVNATYADGVGPYDIRGEWVQVDDLENFPEYDFLADLVQIFDPAEEEEMEMATVLQSATSVSVEPIEVESGTFDEITFTFGWQGLEDVLNAMGSGLSLDAENPITAALVEELSASEADLLTVALLLDDNNVQYGRGVMVEFALSELDASVLDPTLEGTDATVNIDISSAESTFITETNESYPAVEAPETSG